MTADRSRDPDDEGWAQGPALRVLIVDDERLARIRLEDLLAHEPGVQIVGTARNGAAALEAIHTLCPDLVFLDVQMPVMTGLEVVREAGADMPATIFVTAFDQYALHAFDAAAVDYLVKPFTDERFEQAFHRVRRRLALEWIERSREQLLSALQQAGLGALPKSAATSPTPVRNEHAAPPDAAPSADPARYAERIAVESHGKVRAVSVDHIDFITASGSYAELHVRDATSTHRYVIRETMQALENRLDPSRFLRVHRSVIVRLDLVEVLHRAPGGDYEVQLKGGARLKVSRSRHEALERWLGMKP